MKKSLQDQRLWFWSAVEHYCRTRKIPAWWFLVSTGLGFTESTVADFWGGSVHVSSWFYVHSHLEKSRLQRLLGNLFNWKFSTHSPTPPNENDDLFWKDRHCSSQAPVLELWCENNTCYFTSHRKGSLSCYSKWQSSGLWMWSFELKKKRTRFLWNSLCFVFVKHAGRLHEAN